MVEEQKKEKPAQNFVKINQETKTKLNLIKAMLLKRSATEKNLNVKVSYEQIVNDAINIYYTTEASKE